ncbi:hypothetical protein ROHU_011649 [Labeo rohita]|uniref:Uncharacterized protein n=1 Tax=Labeo rohita TaxID=84645 RepID=A0A498LIP4_LABRO|nr:hypothetical protein ROHU_011649 [Labeo rohita]
MNGNGNKTGLKLWPESLHAALLLPSETWWALPLVVEAWEAPTGAPVPILGFCQVIPEEKRLEVLLKEKTLEASAAATPASAAHGFCIFATLESFELGCSLNRRDSK